MLYDLVIKNGTVIDGSGLPRYRADVGVRHGRIVALAHALHLDHARAEVGEQARAVRASEYTGEVEHDQVGERQRVV